MRRHRAKDRQTLPAETKASQIRFPNGARILALPVNASTARGYSANLAAPDGWAQEFECQFMKHAAQVFPLDFIRSAEDSAGSFGPWNIRTPNPTFVDIDIGRRQDLTVAWTLERVAGVLITREILVLENTPFPEQEAILADRVA